MDFELSEEVRQIRDTFARYVDERLAPRAAEIDEAHAFPREAFDYVWLINFAPDLRPNNDSGLVAVWQGPRGALYRIRKTPTAG